MEKNRTKVNIAGTVFTVVSEESEEHTKSVADTLNREIDDVRKAAPGLSLTSAVMLAALNIADSKTKSDEDTDLLRKQIKEYLAEADKYRLAYEECTVENEKLKKDIETYRKRLGERSYKDPAPLSAAVRSVRKHSSAEEAADESAPFFKSGGASL